METGTTDLEYISPRKALPFAMSGGEKADCACG